MGSRAGKGRAVARYLLGNSGVPFISWNGVNMDSPAPYEFVLTTSRNIRNWVQIMYRPKTEGVMRFTIRYDAEIDGVDNAWVAMDARTFVQLLKTHYEAVVEPRMKDGE